VSRCYAAVLIVLFTAPRLFFAQATEATPHNGNAHSTANILHVQSNLIYVPVTVTDSRGVPVGNLSQQDFLVMEDGQPQDIRVFEKHASRPLSVVLAIDTSLSVQKNLSQEKQAALDFVHTVLNLKDQIALTGFSGRVTEYVPFTHDPARIEHGLKNLRGNGPTALYAAITQCARALEAQPGRRVIVLISDGANSMPGVGYSQARMAALHAEASVESVILVPIAASAGRDLAGEHALIQLSRDTGGQYFYVRAQGELRIALAMLAQSLHSEYLLAYYAPPAVASDHGQKARYRKIQVQVSRTAANGSLHVYFRKGYFLGLKQ
jgi:Ca-activated chloride channel family protein